MLFSTWEKHYVNSKNDLRQFKTARHMISIHGFMVAGISIRTTNLNNQSALDLGTLWNNFYQDAITAKITHKLSDDVFVVYTDYASDFTGSYTAIIGHRVTNACNQPDGITSIYLPEATYQKFTSVGEMPQAAIDAWNFIWRNDTKLGRKYSTDFEIYRASGAGSGNKKIEIFLTV